jgi:hypothetical protein
MDQHRSARRLRREKATIRAMIDIYCKAHRDTLPDQQCQKLLEYALHRLDHCRFGMDKPTCAACPVHCYKPDMREQVRSVMRYAGPRMLWRHPWFAIMHLLDSRRHPHTPQRKSP